MKDISSSLFTEDLTTTLLHDSARLERISARELHKYVMGLIGIFILFVITYSIAIYRMTQQEKSAETRFDRSASIVVSK